LSVTVSASTRSKPSFSTCAPRSIAVLPL
jgi:hypothetical protein